MTKESGLLDNVNDGGATISTNGIGDINIQRMTGVDKNIEHYEQMVGNLFVGQRQTPQKVASHIGGMPVINNQNVRK